MMTVSSLLADGGTTDFLDDIIDAQENWSAFDLRESNRSGMSHSPWARVGNSRMKSRGPGAGLLWRRPETGMASSRLAEARTWRLLGGWVWNILWGAS